MFQWPRRSSKQGSERVDERAAAAAPCEFSLFSALRGLCEEATFELDPEGRVRSFAAGQCETLSGLEGCEGLFLIDRLRASDRVVFMHAAARARGGGADITCDASILVDDGGRDWRDIELRFASGGETLLVVATPREAEIGEAVAEVSPDAQTVTELPLHSVTDAVPEMAHELRTPLNAIIGYAQALEAGMFGALAQRQREIVSNISQASEHLVEVANTVLDAARMQAGIDDVQPETGSPVDEIHRACAMTSVLAARRSVTIANRVTRHVGNARFDGPALRQILVNLLSNAIKASDRGGVVSVDARRRDAGLELSVRDVGEGMTLQECGRLGQRFARGRAEPGEATGGLGLVLVKRLVDLHGGTLGVDSTLGGGTTMTVFLPDEPVDKEESTPLVAGNDAGTATDVEWGTALERRRAS